MSLKKEFSFQCSSHYIPHYLKTNNGEDAHFISHTTIAVCDGVGGWSDMGIDSGLFSNELIRYVKRFVEMSSIFNPFVMMRYAYQKSMHIHGSSTMCILSIKDNTIRASNIGDSSFALFRKYNVWKCLFKSQDQQHYFNCPFQLGNESSDSMDDVQNYSLTCKKNDIIVLGTDGLFDNVSIDEIKNVIQSFSTIDTHNMSIQLSHLALNNSQSRLVNTPFAMNALKHGILFHGGKEDDITCVVAKIIDAR